MSLLAVTVGSDPSAVVDDVRAVGWYGVNVYHRLACSGGCYDALSGTLGGVVDACCDTCGLRPVVEVSLYAQPGMIDSDVSACVEEGDVLVFECDPRVPPVLFAVSRPMWEGVLASARGWREFVGGGWRVRLSAEACGGRHGCGSRAVAWWLCVRADSARVGASCAMMSVNTM